METQSGAKKLNKYLIVRIGNEEKEFQFVYISNQSIKDRELYNWLQELASYSLKKPTLGEIQAKQKDIKSILHSKYKAKEIKQMVDKRREDRYKGKPWTDSSLSFDRPSREEEVPGEEDPGCGEEVLRKAHPGC